MERFEFVVFGVGAAKLDDPAFAGVINNGIAEVFPHD